MKSSRSDVRGKFHALPTLRFEDQQLSSFSGLIIFQKLFETLSLRHRLRQCFRHKKVSPIFSQSQIVLLLIVHFLLGFRELRHIRYYQNDPLVLRLLGLKRLPDVATVSRQLSAMDEQSVSHLSELSENLVLERLKQLALPRVTIDFDGTVIGTNRYAEGTSIGFNRKKKGQRSYYPLNCTVAQTGQVLAVHHRNGNVHDSNGAEAFIIQCIEQVRRALPRTKIELRMDGAFFSDAIVSALEGAAVEYTISVPFERFSKLKSLVEQRKRWRRSNKSLSFFEKQWKPDSWNEKRRFVFMRHTEKIQNKKTVQLDLFEPFECGYTFKVIVTNKTLSAERLVAYHNGRGAQEGLFAELKSQNALAYVPTRTWLGNKVYMLSAILAHNVCRDLQMLTQTPQRNSQPQRPALWNFMKIDTIRQRFVRQAGRLIRPQGELTLSMNLHGATQSELLQILEAIEQAA